MVRFAGECSRAEMTPFLNATEPDVLKALLDTDLDQKYQLAVAPGTDAHISTG